MKKKTAKKSKARKKQEEKPRWFFCAKCGRLVFAFESEHNANH